MSDKLRDFQISPTDCGCGPATESCCGPECGPSPEQMAASLNEFEILPQKGEKPRPIQTNSVITGGDRLGAIKSRWGIGRMNYVVTPGLYALGTPDETSEVLVTASYKLSFDKLREALPGRSLFILVLNTFGINVWCAAGKGTFSTEELVRKIEDYKIKEVVSHKRIIVPQLGAPGVSGHEVKKLTGFNVRFGPISAQDIPAYLDAGRKATPEMRRKGFPFMERITLIPVELVAALKAILLLQLVFFFAAGLGAQEGYVEGLMTSGLLAVTSLGAALLAGAVLTPAFLPFLPGRSFSVKSVPVSLALMAGAIALVGPNLDFWSGRLEASAWILMVTALAAFFSMNFTGASTYTSLSGVRKEMGTAVPTQIGLGTVGLVMWVASRFMA